MSVFIFWLNVISVFINSPQCYKSYFVFRFYIQGAIGTNITIDTLCGIMSNDSLGQPLYRYAVVNNLTLDTYGEKCLDFSYANMINDLKKTEWNSSAGVGGT